MSTYYNITTISQGFVGVQWITETRTLIQTIPDKPPEIKQEDFIHKAQMTSFAMVDGSFRNLALFRVLGKAI